MSPNGGCPRPTMGPRAHSAGEKVSVPDGGGLTIAPVCGQDPIRLDIFGPERMS